MQQNEQSTRTKLTDGIRHVAAYLQRSPGIRGLTYFGAAALILETVAHFHDRTHPYALVRIHLTALPFGAALTYALVRLNPDDLARWRNVSLRCGLMQVLQGVGLGTSAFLAWLSIAAAKGWVSSTGWGWEQTSISEVARSIALLGIGHLAVAWNEEMVFRGYGFTTLQKAFGTGRAIGIVIPLFALLHELKGQVLIGQAALGIILLMLRLQSNGIWLPIGYHWAWNVTQTAIFGPAGAAPSIRRLQVHGPYLWVGRPGLPEPGLLSTLIALVMALIVWLWMRRAGTLPAAISAVPHTEG
jgi:membrane protease YdiL (CAAX protease family)